MYLWLLNKYFKNNECKTSGNATADNILLRQKMLIVLTFRVGICHKEMGLGIDLDTTLDITTLYQFVPW